MLSEERLPAWASGYRVLGVGGQTARPIDDVGVLTDSGGWVMVQAKKGLALSSRSDSPLAEALAQVVEAVSVGVPGRPPDMDELRQLDPGVDRALILADERAPKTVSESLADVTDRLRTWPEHVPIAEVATNQNETRARDALLSHLRRSWQERHGEQPDDAELRRLVRPLAVRALRLREDGEHARAAKAMLTDLLSDQDAAGDLWRALERAGLRLAAQQSWMDRESLVADLEQKGFDLRPVTRLRTDIARLRRVTADNIQFISQTATLTAPEGAVALSRDVKQALVSAEGSYALTGGPGAGKTVLLHSLATHLANQNADLVLLSAENLRESAGQTRVELNLQHDLAEVLRGWPGQRQGVLLLDGLDQTRGGGAPSWLPELAQCLQGGRWRIVASIRSFDLQHGRRWRALFRGEPIDLTYAAPELGGVRHLMVKDLTQRELDPLMSASPAMANLVETADERLRHLLANPFNLDIAGQLLAEGHLSDLGHFHSRLDLLDRYWQSRVAPDATSAYDRPHVLKIVIEGMLSDRRQQVSNPTGLPITGAGHILSGLVRDGVLRELPRSPGYPQAPIAFTHPVLFDYAVAILALGDVTMAASLADRLDEDPNLAMVVRPSLDFRLAIAWREDRERSGFWCLALRLAGDAGHELAAAAAASVCARELGTPEDLAPLAAACTDAGLASDWQQTTNAHRLAFLVAAAIGGIDDRNALLDAFGPFISRLAQYALTNDSVDLARLAAQLLDRSAGADQPRPGTPAARYWVQAAVACMGVALAEPQGTGRGRLARIAAPAVAWAAGLDARATRATITAVISPPAISAWDIDVVRRLIVRLPQLAREDPELAVNVGASVWEFEETRDERSMVLDSQIVGMTSTRTQDLEGARHSVSVIFPELAAIDLESSARLLLRLVEAPQMFRWDHSGPTADRPRVRFGGTLEFAGGHRSLLPMVNAFVERLQASAEQAAAQQSAEDCIESAQLAQRVLGRVVNLLVTEFSHCEVWQLLLYRAVSAESSALTEALAPVLVEGGRALLSHHETWVAAGHLAQRLSGLLGPAAHRALEATILSATEIHGGDTSQQQEVRLRRRDMLLTALARGKISHPDARQHLDDLDASSRQALPLYPLAPPDRSPQFTHVPDPDPAEPGRSLVQLRYEANQLTDALQQTHNEDEATRNEGWERLTSCWLQLKVTLANEPASDQDARDYAQLVLIKGARRLAQHRHIGPATEPGEGIFAALRAVLPSAVDPDIEDAVGADWHGAWGETVTTTAISGIATLACRPDWQTAHGSQITALLAPFLDSPNAVYRLLSARAIRGIFPNAEVLLSELEHRLAAEPDRHVLAQLMRALGTQIQAHPPKVDRLLMHIAGMPQWAVLTDDPSADHTLGGNDHTHSAIGYLVVLAAAHATPYASRTVRSWLSRPIDHPTRAARVPSWLRQFLNPTDTLLQTAQERAFELLTLPLAQVSETLSQPTAAGGDSENHARDVRNAVIVANYVTEQAYFASGATEDNEQSEATTPPRIQLRQFARLAFPLLDRYTEVHHPAVTHHIIKTIDYLSETDPRVALLIATRATTGDAYAQEQLALDVILALIKRYLADHHDLVLGDPECTTAVRRLLESFVRVGWDKAIRFAETMDDALR